VKWIDPYDASRPCFEPFS